MLETIANKAFQPVKWGWIVRFLALSGGGLLGFWL